jgi:hypothetical protein
MQHKPSDPTKPHWFLIIVRAKTGWRWGCVAETDPMVKPWGDRLLGAMGLALRFGGPPVVTPDLIWCLCEGGAIGCWGGCGVGLALWRARGCHARLDLVSVWGAGRLVLARKTPWSSHGVTGLLGFLRRCAGFRGFLRRGDRLLGVAVALVVGLALRFGVPPVVTPDLIWRLCAGEAVGVGGKDPMVKPWGDRFTWFLAQVCRF